MALGAGVQACNHCAEGYLMEEWTCVTSCSAGFFATEPNPEIADGHRICRRWAHWCVFRCGWFVYLLMAGFILVVGFCPYVCVCVRLCRCLFFCFVLCLLLGVTLGVVVCGQCVCVRMCSVAALSSSGVTPAVLPVWGRAGGTAAAVPAVTAYKRECVLLTRFAQTVSQWSSTSTTS